MNTGFICIPMANTVTFTQKSTCLARDTLLSCQASKVDHRRNINHHLRFNFKVKYNCFSVAEQTPGLRFQRDATKKMNMVVYAIPPENLPLGEAFPFPDQCFDASASPTQNEKSGSSPAPFPLQLSTATTWTIGSFYRKAWIFGTVATLLLSFTRNKWGPLLQLKEKIETTIDGAERVADIVEDMAEKIDKAAEGAVKNLPKGKLQDAAQYVEKVAENVDKMAENAQDLLEKVEDNEKKVVSFFESTVRQGKSNVETTDSK